MVNAGSVTYQPATAYQGGQVNTPQQQPRESQTQPKQAPAADSQRSDQKTLRSKDESAPRRAQENTREAEATQDSKSSYTRGDNVDVKA